MASATWSDRPGPGSYLAAGAMANPASASADSISVACSRRSEVRDLPGGPGGRVARTSATLAQLRRHHLLDQVRVPVRGGLDRSQVPGLDAEVAERGHRAGHRERVGAVLPAHPPDQSVVFELGQLRFADARRLEELAAGQVRRGLPRDDPAPSWPVPSAPARLP